MDDGDHKPAKPRKSGKRRTGQARASTHRGCGDRLHALQGTIDRTGDARIGTHPIDFLQVLVALFLIIGIWQALFAASGLRQELQRARTSFMAEVADLARAEPGTDAVLGGRLGVASDALLPAEQAATVYHMVLYKQQRWECEEDEDGDYDGAWRTSMYIAPNAITLDGREIAIRLDRPLTMSGDFFTLPLPEEGWGWRCDGRREGSIRYVGYRDGDPVCVFGQTRSDGVLVVERLHGGDCDSFITHLEESARGARKAGSVFLGLALLVEVVWLGIRLPPRLARKQK